MTHLAVFVTHPIQYFSPVWRALADTPGLEVVVHYFSDHGIRGDLDRDFGVKLAWDVPLLEGYEHVFLSRNCDIFNFHEVSVSDAPGLLRRGRFDSVLTIGYMHRFARQVVRAARALGLRSVLRSEFTDAVPDVGRGRLRALVRDAYLRRFYRQVDAFCYIGEDARDHLLRRKIPADRLFFSPYCVDTSLFEAQRRAYSRAQIRAELQVADDQAVVLFSGKLIPRKAPLLLLEAVRGIPGIDNVVVLFVGDGPMRGEVEALAREVLGTRFRMVGFVNQSRIGQYYLASDLFVLPSLYETWGLVVNEAMQFGLPVVVGSNVRCHRDLVIEGETGFTFPNGDREALASRLEALLHDPMLAARMGESARSHVLGYTPELSARGIAEAVFSRAGPRQTIIRKASSRGDPSAIPPDETA